MNKDKHIVCLAYACEPNLGSESELGWMWASIVGKINPAIVLTRHISYLGIPGLELITSDFGKIKIYDKVCYKSIDMPILKNINGGHVFLILHYLIWQVLCLIWVLRRKCLFCVAHHINFVSAWLPPLIALSGIRTIWGPVGTGSRLPSWAKINLKAKIWNYVTQYPGWFPFYSTIVGRVEMVLPINDHVRSLLERHVKHSSFEVFPAVAYDTKDAKLHATYRKPSESTVIYAGRYYPSKLPHLAAMAGTMLMKECPGLRFVMIGEDLKENLQNEFADVKFFDKFPRDEFVNCLPNAQLLLFPTAEGSSYLALEALSCGLPIVTTENSGPAFFIGDIAGKTQKLLPTEKYTAMGLAALCKQLLESEDEWNCASRSALRRSMLFNSASLNNRVASVYAEMHLGK